MTANTMDFDLFGGVDLFDFGMEDPQYGLAKVPEQLYSPLEPLVFGDFSTASFDPLLDGFANGTPMSSFLDDTPPLTVDCGSTDSGSLSPLLSSPTGELDMPLFMSPAMLDKGNMLLPQSDHGLMPIDSGFTLDLAQIESSSPSSGPQRSVKTSARKQESAPTVHIKAVGDACSEVVFSPSPARLEGESEEQARRRKAREAQRKCRAKKQAHLDSLEFQIAALADEQATLLARRNALLAEVARKRPGSK